MFTAIAALGTSVAGGIMGHKAKEDAENHAKNLEIERQKSLAALTGQLIPLAAVGTAVIIALLLVKRMRAA